MNLPITLLAAMIFTRALVVYLRVCRRTEAETMGRIAVALVDDHRVVGGSLKLQ